METIKLPQHATKSDFCAFVGTGERDVRDFIGYPRIDQNGDLCILDSIPPENYSIAKVDTLVVEFTKVTETPEGKRRSLHGEFVGWKKETVGKIVGVRRFGHGSTVRYDLKTI